jgi:hypothetical protein
MAGNQGFASMSEEEAKAIQSKGGQNGHNATNKTTPSLTASSTSRNTGAAGKTAAAKRGGQNSHGAN